MEKTARFPSLLNVPAARRSVVAGAVVALFATVGCSAGIKMTNTSPEKLPASSGDASAFPGTVSVVDVAPSGGASVANDVVTHLRAANVFSSVTLDANAQEAFVLNVKSKTESDHHLASGLGKAFLCGLTLGLACLGQTDDYDYKVQIDAELKCQDGAVGSYQVVGSYHSEVPEGTSLQGKQERVVEAVKNSYHHAMSLLSAKLREDRQRIESTPCAKLAAEG